MRSELQPLFEASLRAQARALLDETNTPGDGLQFIEEHGEHFVVVHESAASSIRLTHRLDRSSGSIAIYCGFRNGIRTAAALANALRLSIGSGCLRFAIGEKGELCLRADCDPTWKPLVLGLAAEDLQKAARELIVSATLDPVESPEEPRKVHLARLARGSSDPLGESPGPHRLQSLLSTLFSEATAIADAVWSFSVRGKRTYICTAWLARGRLILSFTPPNPYQTDLSILREALLSGYAFRFFKIYLDSEQKLSLGVEVPLALTESEVMGFLAGLLPRYLDKALERLPVLMADAP